MGRHLKTFEIGYTNKRGHDVNNIFMVLHNTVTTKESVWIW